MGISLFLDSAKRVMNIAFDGVGNVSYIHGTDMWGKITRFRRLVGYLDVKEIPRDWGQILLLDETVISQDGNSC